MEIATSALLLLVILLPGFILQIAYAKGFWRWNSPTTNRPIVERVPTGIIIAGILHLIWIPLASCANNNVINLNTLVMFLTGKFGHDDELFSQALISLTGNPGYIAAYFFSLYIFSLGMGTLGHYLVRRFHIDHATRFLRFDNEWYYWLTGEITSFQETANVDGKIHGVYLTTVVHHSGCDYLYTGFVKDFFFDKEGHLDRVILENTERRKMSDDKIPTSTDNRYYKIEGNYFVLRYSEMVTVNLKYVCLKPDNSPGPPEAEVPAIEPCPTSI